MYNPSSTIWQRNMAPLSKTVENNHNSVTSGQYLVLNGTILSQMRKCLKEQMS